MKRIEFIDGLRGIAILLVLCYHAFTRWTLILPYGDKFANVYPFKFGYLGVELFFLISGFVILMSLEKGQSFYVFLYKRWLRLFPGMMICSFIIYISAQIFVERPLGIPTIKSVLPGLFFIEPSWINLLFGTHFSSLEGSFWSLFVEFKFYVLFGGLYFILGKERALLAMLIFIIFSIFVNSERVHYLTSLSCLFSLEYFGWFLSGSLSYLFYVNKQLKYLLYAIFIGVAQILFYNQNALVFSFFLLVLFNIPIFFVSFRRVMSSPILLFLGFVSYPLYLLHENMMVSLIIKMGKLDMKIPNEFLAMIPMAILVFVAYFVAKVLEPSLKNILNGSITKYWIN
ncbi:MAG: acyltransferase family protein [Bacteroidales bacterium]